jgi:hypothetical protein
VLVGSEPPQGLEALSEVVGVEEGFEVLSELLVGRKRCCQAAALSAADT